MAEGGGTEESEIDRSSSIDHLLDEVVMIENKLAAINSLFLFIDNIGVMKDCQVSKVNF